MKLVTQTVSLVPKLKLLVPIVSLDTWYLVDLVLLVSNSVLPVQLQLNVSLVKLDIGHQIVTLKSNPDLYVLPINGMTLQISNVKTVLPIVPPVLPQLTVPDVMMEKDSLPDHAKLVPTKIQTS